MLNAINSSDFSISRRVQMNSKNTKKDNKNNQSDFYIRQDQRESRFLHSQKEMTLKMNTIDAYKNVNIREGCYLFHCSSTVNELRRTNKIVR